MLTVAPCPVNSAARRRKATIRDSDDEDEAASGGAVAAVTPMPMACDSAPTPSDADSSTTAEPRSETAREPTQEASAAPVDSSAAAAEQKKPPEQPKVLPSAAPGKARAAEPKVAASASKADSDVEDEQEDDSDADEEEEEAAGESKDGTASGSARPGKTAGKASKAKVGGKAAIGATAAKIAYHKYDVLGAATWEPGKPVPYLFLARVFGRIEDEPKRLLITELMADAFRTVIATSPDDLLPMMAVSINKLAPAYEGVELGIGDSIMIKAVSETCGRSVDAIKANIEEVGDLGEVAMASRTKQVTLMKPKPLTVGGMYKSLKEIAMTSGNEAMKRKKDKIKQMLVAAQEKEAQYIVRSLQGKMRIGLAEQTALVALAHAFVLTAPPGRDPPPELRGEALQERLAEAEAIIKQARPPRCTPDRSRAPPPPPASSPPSSPTQPYPYLTCPTALPCAGLLGDAELRGHHPRTARARHR